MCFEKKNSNTIVFLYCDINQFKTLKISSPFIDQERFSFSAFPFIDQKDFSFSFDFAKWRVQLWSIITSSKKVKRQICSRGY